MMRLIILVCLAVSTLVAPGFAQPAAGPAQPQTQADAGLRQRLRDAIVRETLGTWWGAIFVVRDGGPVLVYTNGFRDESSRPFDENTLFDMGDLSMQFTSAALLKLEQDGKLSIDDPVSRFFPDAAPQARSITVRHLMSHSSGLSDSSQLPEGLDLHDRDATALAVLATQPSAQPGQAWGYCRRGYSVLAAIIEIASQKPFEQFMRDEVFAKLGMTRTGFADGKGLDPQNAAIRVSTGRVTSPGRSPLFLQPGQWSWAGRGSAGVITCAADAARWEQAMLSDALLTAPQRSKMVEVQKDFYALGAYVTTTHRDTRRMWAGGASPGYIAVSFRFVDENASVFVVSNEKGDADLMAFALSDIIFPPLPIHLEGEIFLGEKARTVDLQEIPGDVSFLAARENGNIRLDIGGANGGRPLSRLILSEGLARRTAAALKDTLRSTADKGASGTITTLDPRHLGVRTDGRAVFSPEARLEIRSFLKGQGPDGQEVREDRPVLAVIDPKAKGWPLIVRMDTTSARTLYETLSKSINE
jgi:CubicO group peptidase (beta-lactamase class C family)